VPGFTIILASDPKVLTQGLRSTTVPKHSRKNACAKPRSIPYRRINTNSQSISSALYPMLLVFPCIHCPLEDHVYHCLNVCYSLTTTLLLCVLSIRKSQAPLKGVKGRIGLSFFPRYHHHRQALEYSMHSTATDDVSPPAIKCVENRQPHDLGQSQFTQIDLKVLQYEVAVFEAKISSVSYFGT
jgi:hypothetical protein